MANNLEYLITRPGILKIATIAFGLIAFILASVGYIHSPYTDFYSNQTVNGNPANLPSTDMEITQLAITGTFLGISTAYLLAYGFIYELCESKFNRLVDTAFHLLASLLTFGGGCIQFYSAIEIENYGCDMYHIITNGPVPKHTHDHNFCQHFGSKIVGGGFSILNAVIYCVTAVTVFITKDL